MTRRIVAAILLTVWAILIAGGLTAYWVTRSVLVADLDDLLTQRAITAAQLARSNSEDSVPLRPLTTVKDRWVITTDVRKIQVTADAEPASPVPSPRKASFSQLADGQWMRTVTVQVPAPPREDGSPSDGPITVVYSSPADQINRVLSRLALTLTICGVAAGAAAAAMAAGAARAALRPLHDASDVVGDIDERNLDRRIDTSSLPPELRPVAARLNAMLERLEAAFARRKQFLADASHELRTPVAALVTTIEVALRRRRSAEDLERTLASCLSDARHLKRLVHVLMEHARGEASTAGRVETTEPFDATQLLDECADIAATLAAVKDVRIERLFATTLPVTTQPQRLRSVVMNLLSNAVEYNRPGGIVQLSAQLSGGALEVEVRDTGCGIEPENVPHLFEPFYRVDGARRGAGAAGQSEDAPHLGLGLFLVDSHLKALGGRCTVQSEPGVGTTMQVSVPAGGNVRIQGSTRLSSVTASGHGGSAGSMNLPSSPTVMKGVGV